MKRALLALVAVVWIAAGTGCHWQNAGLQGEQQGGGGYGACSSCGGEQYAGGVCSSCGGSTISGDFFSTRRARKAEAEAMEAAGPPTGATGYPYYTTRGPRDYFTKEPMSIGY